MLICFKMGLSRQVNTFSGKDEFSFQSQSRAMPKNVQTTYNCTHFRSQQGNAQNPSSQASTIHEPRTSRCTSWIQKRQGKQIKLPISSGSQKKQENSRKTSPSALLIMPRPLTVQITTNCRRFLKRWEYQTTLPAS